MMKRMTAMLLICMMLVSLAGCGSKNKATNEDDSTSTTATKAPTATDATDNETEEEVPAERQKITVAIYDRGNIPASEGTITDNRWTRWINENAPVDVEFVSIPRWESAEKYNTLFASGTAPDLIEEFSVANMNSFYANGLIMPLDDIINEHSTEYKTILGEYPALAKFLQKEDGKMYTFGVVYSAGSNHYLVIRTDWLKNVGLSIPKTDAEFAEVCRAFTYDDPDKNGQDDTLGLSLSATTYACVTAMFGGMGSWKSDWYLEDPTDYNSEFVYHWDHAETYTKFMKDLYDGGFVSKDFATDTNGSQSTQDFINGKIGILGLNGGKGAVLNLLTNLTAITPDADIEAIALPTTEYGTFGPAGGNFQQSNAAINASCENPEAVMAYIDWLNTPETLKMLKYGGDEYSQVDPVTGAYVPKDLEKFTTEVGYTGDFYMTSSRILDPFSDILAFDEADPIQKRAKEIVIAADKLYLSTDIIHYQLMSTPALTEELNLVSANIGTQIDDIYKKCILGGADYSTEQAMTDAKKIFSDAGGDSITDFYVEWYKNNNGFATNEELAQMLPAYVR
jgi:putative aldouronate transport system substrate-binding protein